MESLQQELAIHRAHDGRTVHLELSLPVDPLCDEASALALSKALRETGTTWERLVALPSIEDVLPKAAGLYMFVWRPMLSFALASLKHPTMGSVGGSDLAGEERLACVLYVGKAGDSSSNTIRNRFRSDYKKYLCADAKMLWQRSGSSRQALLARWLNLWPLEFWYLEVDQDNEIGRLEQQLIRALSPPCNNYLKARKKSVRPAFKEQ